MTIKKGKALAVWWDGSIAGVLLATDGDLTFSYSQEWLATKNARPLSVSLPPRAGTYKRSECRPFFAGLLPDETQREKVAKILGLSEGNDFALLAALGGEVAGAISLMPLGESPPTHSQAANNEPLSNEALEDVLQTLPKRPLLAGREGIRLSLAGAQSKLPVVVSNDGISLPAMGQASTHILKPPIRDFAATTENEAFCLRLAAACKLDVAKVEARSTGQSTFIVVERYDRAPQTGKKKVGRPKAKFLDGESAGRLNYRRIHQEDFCQALGISPELKYASEGGPSFPACAQLLRRASIQPAADLFKLLDAALFNLIIGNCDAHGKNFSLLYTEQGAVLAPLYDLLSTVVYPGLSHRLAMEIGGDATLEDMTDRTWERFAKDIGMAAPFVRRRAGEMAALAADRAQVVADGLKLPFLDAAALDGYAELVRDRAAKVSRIAQKPARIK
jgi:serine/threonine-protein kinase HipA